MEGIIDSESQAVLSGFKAIKKIEGNLGIKRVPNKFAQAFSEGGKADNRDRAEISLTDSVIVEIAPGAVAPELKEGKFTQYIPYAEPGLEPTQQSIFVRGFLRTAQKVDAARRGLQDYKEGKLSNVLGTRVTLVQGVVEYTGKDKDTGEKTSKAFPTWLVEEAGVGQKPIEEYVLGLVVGQRKNVALRNVVLDDRTKSDPKWKTAIETDTLDKLLPVKLVEDVYQKV